MDSSRQVSVFSFHKGAPGIKWICVKLETAFQSLVLYTMYQNVFNLVPG